MKRTQVLMCGLLLLAACASGNWPTEVDSTAVVDAPDHFVVVDPATGASSDASGPACHNPMIDPRDGTRLTLIRSNAGFGDYQPEKPRYGLSHNQLLRIECSNGRPLGATAVER